MARKKNCPIIFSFNLCPRSNETINEIKVFSFSLDLFTFSGYEAESFQDENFIADAALDIGNQFC